MSNNIKSHDIGIYCEYFLSMKDGSAKVENDIYVGITGNIISEISKWSEDKKLISKKFIEAKNKIVMPGLINGHTHLAMTLFRGLGDDLPFHEWLFQKILPLEMSLVDEEFVRVGTELAVLECIRFGVTTVNDMYFYAKTIAEVINKMGIRAVVAQVWATAELPEDKVLGKNKTKLFESFHENYSSHARITPSLGPHAPYTCSDEIYKEVARLSEKYSSPIHTHLSETSKEVEDSFIQFHKSPVQRLSELGVLSSKTICAHCVHLSDDDLEIVKKSKANIVYNPDSNLKLSSGISPVAKFRKQNIPVAFGTDGAASNNDLSVFGAMDVGTKLQKLISKDNTAMTAVDALVCGTWEAAKVLGLQNKIGSLEVNKRADIILIDLDFPHLKPIHDIRSQLVYATQGLEVDMVICDGKILLENKKFTNIDENKIFNDSEKMKNKIQAALK